jgi:thiamine biosynthesis lipoprotein
MMRLLVGVAIATAVIPARAAEPLVVAGPAMGTTYRVALAGPVAGVSLGEVHREVESVLARIDRSASGWREDSELARCNRAAAGEWVEIGPDLAALVAIARRVHDESGGAFDITAAPLVRLSRAGGAPSSEDLAGVRSRVGLGLVEVRAAADGQPAAIRMLASGVELDVNGIGPGYAVDRIGERLERLGSRGHLVELGGEVRAWGTRADGEPWRVGLRGVGAAAPRTVDLAAGEALATASVGAGRLVVDPRSGRAVSGPARSVTVIAESCAVADAWAVAALVLDLPADSAGLVRVPPAPSRRAGRPGATRAPP